MAKDLFKQLKAAQAAQLENLSGEVLSGVQKARLLRFFYTEKSKSQCVNTVTYDPVTRELTVAFQQRGTYKYHEVPLEEYIEFDSAGSRGTYFNLNIRDRYSYERVA